jgi:hypothetical protein
MWMIIQESKYYSINTDRRRKNNDSNTISPQIKNHSKFKRKIPFPFYAKIKPRNLGAFVKYF